MSPTAKPEESLWKVPDRLLACQRPFLIGVRHHSPACAARMEQWLDEYAPQVLLLELPPDFEPWLPWLAHPQTQAPVALAGCDGRDNLFFYPFADFSPELAALRWAARHQVPVVPFDLPAGHTVEGPPRRFPQGLASVLDDWMGHLQVDNFDDLWDQKVEAVACAVSAETLRHSALLSGWLQRLTEAGEPGLRTRDLARETAMREVLTARQEERVAAVVGSFHASALLDPPVLWQPVPARQPDRPGTVRTSFIPYSFELLDSRSGYPAGIRDPRWQQEVFSSGLCPRALRDLASQLAVELCQALRQERHPAGSPDAVECARMALQLAQLRGLPAPGRREFLEGVQSSMAQGELLGRGRALARALQSVMVSQRRGRLAPGTPRSGLAPHTEEVLRRLKLPLGPGELRLDPLRSRLDRSRHVTLRRLETCGVVYGSTPFMQGSDTTLTVLWQLHWTPASEASLELAGFRGVTLAQAAAGVLRDPELPLVPRLRQAAECGLTELTEQLLGELSGEFLRSAALPNLLEAVAMLDRIRLGQVPGLPLRADGVEPVPLEGFDWPQQQLRDTLLQAAMRSLDGLRGSTQLADARALGELIRLAPTGLRLRHVLAQMVREGSPLMQGAATAVTLLLAEPAGQGEDGQPLRSGEQLAPRLLSWLQAPPDQTMVGRWTGLLALASPLLESRPELLQALEQAIAELDDQGFLRRVPSLREAFEVLSPAERARFGSALLQSERALELPAQELTRLALADLTGRRAVEQLGLFPQPSPLPAEEAAASPSPPRQVRGELSLEDRYRLLLGQPPQTEGSAARAARALEELYGRGRGEGSRASLGGGSGVGEGSPPGGLGAWDWGEELAALFGEPVRQEVLGRAAERGRGAALLALDPAAVRPSVQLLQQALSLVGGLSEAQMQRLRPLVARVIEQLVRELSSRLRPALTGLRTPRTTRRPGPLLDLGRTMRANLHTAHPQEEGWRLAPERLFFRTRARRSLDWRVVLVVDVSGSMQPSLIYSALMSAILAGLPALTVHFVAFSTEVIDFSERAADPLALLLEVRVGGGTLIAPALAYARGLLQVPARSLVLLISDFEDGGRLPELLAEVRALVESGARPLGLAALDDGGKPRYCEATAAAVVDAGMPVAALTPLELARWVGEQIGGAR